MTEEQQPDAVEGTEREPALEADEGLLDEPEVEGDASPDVDGDADEGEEAAGGEG